MHKIIIGTLQTPDYNRDTSVHLNALIVMLHSLKSSENAQKIEEYMKDSTQIYYRNIEHYDLKVRLCSFC